MKWAMIVLLLVSVLWSASLYASDARISSPKTGKIPVAIVLTEHANLIDFAGPWETFNNVRVPGRGNSKGVDDPEDDQYPFRLYTVGDQMAPLGISSGLTVTPQYSFENAPPPAIVVVGAQKGSDKMKAWLQKVATDPNTQVIMSVCTGAFKLGSAGLLNGKSATTHHGYYDDFAKSFPNVHLQKGVRFVQSDAHIFTAGGLTSGIDLSLHIVQLYFGESVARQTAEWLEYQGQGWHSTTD